MARVLLIEDDPLMVRMYQRKLVNDGYEAAVAVDGEDGLVKVRSFRPDLVLLDIMMPKLNGLQVLERLKADPTTAKTPVVILTNLGGTQDDIERGLELGAVAYLVKSAYRPDEVIAKVKEVLAGYTHSREIPKTAAESLGGAARVMETTEHAAAQASRAPAPMPAAAEKPVAAEAPVAQPPPPSVSPEPKKERVVEAAKKSAAAGPEEHATRLALHEDAEEAEKDEEPAKKPDIKEATLEEQPIKQSAATIDLRKKTVPAEGGPMQQPVRKERIKTAIKEKKAKPAKEGEKPASEAAANEMIW